MRVVHRKWLFLQLLILSALPQAQRQLAHGQMAAGIQPFGSYSAGFDQIDLGNLGVHIDIPLVADAGRGENNGASLHLVYDSSYLSCSTCSETFADVGWRLTYGNPLAGNIQVHGVTTQCTGGQTGETHGNYTSSTITFVDATGFVNNFAGKLIVNACTNGGSGLASTNLNELSEDGSGVLLVATSQAITVTTPSGRRYSQAACSGSSGLCNTVVDANGNSPAVNNLSGTNYGESGTITDNYGVQYTLSGGSYNSANATQWTLRSPLTIEYTDPSGDPHNIVIAYKMYSVLINAPEASPVTQNTGLVDSITYTDGSAYHFLYQSPLTAGVYPQLLGSVEMPTGATITYMNSAHSAADNCVATPMTLTRESPDGTTTYTNTQNFSTGCEPSTASGAISKPDGTSEAIDFVSALFADGTSTQYETAHTWNDTTGAKVRSTMRCYNGAAGDCTSTPIGSTPATTFPITEISTTTTLAGQSSSSKSLVFLNAYSLPTELDEYDFGASTPTRKTITSYASPGNNILNKPASITIWDVTSNTMAAQTTYGYDEYTLPGLALQPVSLSSNTLQSVSGSRGNRTSQHSWILASNKSLDTHWQYDVAGQITGTEDPRSNWTYYVYDKATDTCLSTITYPSPRAGVSLSAFATCDPYAGLPATSTDLNGTKATYSFNAMLRPAGASVTSNGATVGAYTINYSGSALPETITTTVTATPSPNEVSTTTLDSLGRVSNTVAPSGATTTMKYDSLGRLYTVTDPSTDTVSYYYDAAGRPIVQQRQDGYYLEWCYNNITPPKLPTGVVKNCGARMGSTNNGTWVIFSDEAGNEWQQTTDGLGRLTSLLEPNGDSKTPSMETDYAYTVLGNLLKAIQAGYSADGEAPRVQTFTYDSLSELLCAANPENSSKSCPSSEPTNGVWPSATVLFTYDNNGNLATKTDARGITINYSPSSSPIDALNRVTEKTYSDGSPTVHYAYDTSPESFNASQNYFKGRLTEYWTTGPQGQILVNTFKQPYDPMGRDGGFFRCAFASCNPPTSSAGAQLYTFEYGYDEAGNVTGDENYGGIFTSSTESLVGIQRNYGRDAAGRLSTIETSPLKNGTSGAVSYLFAANSTSTANPSYGPFGLLNAGLSLQSGFVNPAISRTRGYDNRGRLQSETNTNTQGQTLYYYFMGYGPNNNVDAAVDSTAASSNGLMGIWGYYYDSLNRLSTAVTDDSGPFCCGQWAWTYDGFGNRKSESFTGATPASILLPANFTFTSSATNRADQLSAYYDAAGNLLFDTLNYYRYDGEGRLCAVGQPNGTEVEYIYDANGLRVAKGTNSNYHGPLSTLQATVSSLSCDQTNGFTATSNYIYDAYARQLAEYDGSGNLLHENVLADGEQLATYTQSTGAWLYAINDWLGTRRVQIGADGSTNFLGFTSLPFGDNLSLYGVSATEDHFTGKDRDSESGNDYFGARYYSSNQGRFMSPDPAGAAAVNPANPQSWNMYSYALNNPLTNTDPTGLDCVYFNDAGNGADSVDHNSNSGECGANGGDWVNGTTSTSQIQYNANNDTFSIQSSSLFHNYDTTASAPGSQTDGTMCNGNCDTPTGYSSRFSLANLQNSAYSVSGFQSLSTLILPMGPIPVPVASFGWSPTVTYIPKTNTGCLGVAIGASTGTGKTLSATVYPSSDAQFSKAVTSEWGWNLNAQPVAGAGVSVNTNSSGTLVGYTLATNAGASATYGYTWCKDF